jgi:hypothetical protein
VKNVYVPFLPGFSNSERGAYRIEMEGYRAFPNCDALRHELSWTNDQLLFRVGDSDRTLDAPLKGTAQP